ncbi:MAG: TonB-dependent receptor, partial [Bacteroidota bacterium]
LFTLLFVTSHFMWSQENILVSGRVLDESQSPLVNVVIVVEGTELYDSSTSDGQFSFETKLKGNYILSLSSKDYLPKRLPLILGSDNVDLGSLRLQLDIAVEKSNNLITLTENDLSDDEGTRSSSLGLLQATRDIFLTRAAFDFGQAFFRVRGYDSREGQVLLNGLVMNKFFDGRPQWNNWGGLNDQLRNQEFTNGLEAFSFSFGGILGNTNIDMRPSGLRPGTRFSTSFSNRTYSGRLMATHTIGINKKGIGYSLSASRRWANQGFINGTLYDAYSFFSAFEYQFNPRNSLVITTILAKNRRGRSSPITEEVFELTGNNYNPNWGEQLGKIRNSRERTIFEPIAILNHYHKSNNFQLTSGIVYQTGTRTRSRLGYFNAPNPNPTYFRYLPSFYINNPIGADFTNAALARTGFLNHPQISWPQLYTANTNPENLGKAAYILQDDALDDTQISLASTASIRFSHSLKLNIGTSFRFLNSKNYAKIIDLLGAEFHENIDPFSKTRNDINSPVEKVEGDIFNYQYTLKVSEWSSYAQATMFKRPWKIFLAANLSGIRYQRDGLFQNERFLDNSFGPSEQLQFSNFEVKAGLSYQISGRHWLRANGGLIERPPTLQNTFVNPRENNGIVPNIQSEAVSTVDLNYFIRLPDLTARLTGFYTRFQNTTDINFFFVDAGVGSDFVQEVITDLDKLHMGLELGVEYQTSPQVKLSLVANLGKYLYASNPNITINFDTAGAEEDFINPEGFEDLGIANIKDLRLSQGPQTAFALGVEYRNPKYWWIGATANFLADNYANISTITRTPSFILNPETGQPFMGATPENVSQLLQQQSLDDFYLLNVVGGKSWLIDGKYISFFASINNLFDTVYRTGGFEQSRNGNFGQLQQDNLRNDPSFAPRYWYGFGRTFFLNLAVSF